MHLFSKYFRFSLNNVIFFIQKKRLSLKIYIQNLFVKYSGNKYDRVLICMDIYTDRKRQQNRKKYRCSYPFQFKIYILLLMKNWRHLLKLQINDISLKFCLNFFAWVKVWRMRSLTKDFNTTNKNAKRNKIPLKSSLILLEKYYWWIDFERYLLWLYILQSTFWCISKS